MLSSVIKYRQNIYGGPLLLLKYNCQENPRLKVLCVGVATSFSHSPSSSTLKKGCEILKVQEINPKGLLSLGDSMLTLSLCHRGQYKRVHRLSTHSFKYRKLC